MCAYKLHALLLHGLAVLVLLCPLHCHAGCGKPPGEVAWGEALCGCAAHGGGGAAHGPAPLERHECSSSTCGDDLARSADHSQAPPPDPHRPYECPCFCSGALPSISPRLEEDEIVPLTDVAEEAAVSSAAAGLPLPPMDPLSGQPPPLASGRQIRTLLASLLH